MGAELEQNQNNVLVYRRDQATGLHHQCYRELSPSVAESDQGQESFPHRYIIAETSVSGDTELEIYTINQNDFIFPHVLCSLPCGETGCQSSGVYTSTVERGFSTRLSPNHASVPPMA